MNFLRSNIISLFLLVAVVILCASCTALFGFSTVLTGLTTSTAFTGGYYAADRTDIFYIDSPQICCSAKLMGAHPGTEIKARWIYIQGKMTDSSGKVMHSSKAVCDNDCHVGFTWDCPPEGFMAGEYRVNLSIDDKPVTSASFFIQQNQTGSLPQISSFTASPPSITSGQASYLKWKVADATRVILDSSTVPVSAEGEQKITPSVDTTYTLWALNRYGSSSSRLTVGVVPLISNKADLTVTDFWSTGNVIFYKVKNAGNQTSCPTTTYLYSNDKLTAEDYVHPLDPDQEQTESFGSYHFSPRFPQITGSSPGESGTDAVHIRVCANGSSACLESNTDNNCVDHNFGSLLNLHLTRYVHSAQWECSTGKLVWPMLHDKDGGWAQLATAQVDDSGAYPGSLIMVLPHSADTWMEARIGLPGSTTQQPQPISIPHKCKITARVGVTHESSPTVNVKFSIGTIQGNEVNYYPPVIIDSKGKLATYEADLGQLAGERVLFVLRVESSEPLRQGSAVWIDPTLIQER